MKKNAIRWWVVLGVVLVVYNVLAFALPFPKTAVFAVSYLFTMIAILAQIYVIRTAFYRGEGVKSKFYGFPIAKLGVIYLAVQLIAGLVFMALGLIVPVWLPLALYVVLLGIAAAGFVAADAVRDEVVRQEIKLEKDVSRMREFQAKGRALVTLNQVSEAARPLEKLAENLRFSDPVSSEALTEIEDQLAECLAQLQEAVSAQKTEQILSVCQEAERILAERNQLCKLSKTK
ncbi:hypothetical protein [Pseudoflavonifractor capillosus]|uniref:hypothetical protein n=1 Tax=Pseudoflavonifractor capillosus TaxID=106588 RepID=UPI0019583251|nr:hypothetical protein [Pseudoflavonifractor capillosus]MBM6679769.1 hypothetical protein [Pseudoflavonifractor capillosus]